MVREAGQAARSGRQAARFCLKPARAPGVCNANSAPTLSLFPRCWCGQSAGTISASLVKPTLHAPTLLLTWHQHTVRVCLSAGGKVAILDFNNSQDAAVDGVQVGVALHAQGPRVFLYPGWLRPGWDSQQVAGRRTPWQ